jgi:hypothetical protein
MKKYHIFINLFTVTLMLSYAVTGEVYPQQPLKSASLEQLTIAVPDLLESSNFFGDSLGFTIKMGSLHSNSMENSYIKFKDKSSVELVTAKIPMDDLAKWYIKYIKQFPNGAGAFLGIRIDDEDEMNSIEELIIELGMEYSRLDFQYSDIIYFGEKVSINTLFFIRYKVEVKERSSFLKHKNTGGGLQSVWINSPQPDKAAELLRKFGFKIEESKELNVDYPVEFKFFVGDKPVYIVDSEREERIAGISIICSDLDTFRKLYKDKTGVSVSIKQGYDGNYILLDKRDQCGMWIKFINFD